MGTSYHLRGDEAVKALSKIGEALLSPNNTSPSALTGNYKADVRGFTLDGHISEFAHRHLRGMTHKIGSRVDWSALSPTTLRALEDMKQAKRHYAATVRPLIKFHTDIIQEVEQETTREKLKRQNYPDLERLNTVVDTALRCMPDKARRQRATELVDLKEKIGEVEWAVAPVVGRLMTQLDQEKEFQLIDGGQALQNCYVLPNKLKGSPLEILYCYHNGAQALADTTRIPNHYAVALFMRIGNSRKPLACLQPLLNAAPQLKQPVIYGDIETAYASIQRDVAIHSEFSELQLASGETRKVITHLLLDNEEIYNDVRAQSSTTHPTPLRESTPRGRCPFGYGAS